MDDITFADNTHATRFELHKAGALAALADYTRAGNTLTFTHTEVLPGHEGQGLASKLAAYALDQVRASGLKAVAQCEFIAGYIAKRPQYQDLLAG